MADQEKRGTPRTGNGRTGGPKPKTEDLKMLTRNNQVARHQPDGWVGKVIKLFKEKP